MLMSDAILSDCGTYRYWLQRKIEGGRTRIPVPLVFVMLNPSTADADVDDPTIRRCMGFAKTWGYGSLEVINLYALRSTDPKNLKLHSDPVGPNNLACMVSVMGRMVDVVCAWGGKVDQHRVDTFLALARTLRIDLWCLKVNKDGSPKHPLYAKADLPMKLYLP